MRKRLVSKLINFNDNDYVFQIGIILSLVFIVYCIVYASGGTQFACVHLMYIPIIIAAFIFNIKGGIGVALLSGIILGPFMPVNVSIGLRQDLRSCILRIIFFTVMGLILGLLFDYIKKNKEIQIKSSYEHVITGYPNVNKLKIDLTKMIDNKENFSLVTLKFTNLNDINRYSDITIGQKAVFKELEIAEKVFDKNSIYSIYTNELAVIMPNCNIEKTYLKTKDFLSNFKDPIVIDRLPIGIIIKAGIVNFPMHSKEVNDLFKKLGRTLDQKSNDENDICIYDDSIAQKMKEDFETAVFLYDAIKYDKFTIVYQPKVNQKKNEVMGVEALLRWNNEIKGNMNPAKFIKIAEDVGIINEITKWVIRNVICQLKKWQEDGIRIKTAINISSKDLNNNSIIEYTRNCIKENQIDPAMLEFELTERTIVENENKVENLLSYIKDTGMKISLDDFGTGYNSLIHLVSLPIDYIKIDKVFIDNINNIHNRTLIQSTIDLAHNLGKEVIAEGVETEEQMKMLYSMGCDNVQGYYFSKPLPPEGIKDFILNFNK